MIYKLSKFLLNNNIEYLYKFYNSNRTDAVKTINGKGIGSISYVATDDCCVQISFGQTYNILISINGNNMYSEQNTSSGYYYLYYPLKKGDIINIEERTFSESSTRIVVFNYET